MGYAFNVFNFCARGLAEQFSSEWGGGDKFDNKWVVLQTCFNSQSLEETHLVMTTAPVHPLLLRTLMSWGWEHPLPLHAALDLNLGSRWKLQPVDGQEGRALCPECIVASSWEVKGRTTKVLLNSDGVCFTFLSLCAAKVGLFLRKVTQRCCLFFLVKRVSEEESKIM